MANYDTWLSNGGLLRLHVNLYSQDIANNTSHITWSLELINTNTGGRYASGTWYWSVGFGNGWEYLGHGSGANYNIGAGGSIILGSGASNVAHNADGTYSRGFYGGFSDIPNYGWWGNGTASGDWAAPTIPRATTPNWSGNFETGVAKTINLPRATSGFTHDVEYSFGSSGWVSIATGVGVTTSWTPPESLASQIPNASSGTGTIRVTTKSGSTTIGSKTATFTLGLDTSVVPVVNTVTWDDANTTVKNNIGAFVQNASQIFGLVTSSGIHGSTIVKEELVVNGVTIPEASSLVVDMSGTITASGKATDSRNRIGTKAANIPVLAYVPPQVTAFEVLRSNSAGVAQDDGSYLKLVLSAAVQSLIVASTQKNAMTIVVKTKPKNGVWTTRNTITPGLSYNTSVLISGGATYPASTSYSVRVEITDKTGSTYIAETTVATGSVTMDLNDTKVGIGKFWEQGALDVAGPVYADGEKLITTNEALPAGSILAWGGSTPPSNWLLCDGSAVSRTTYSDLFSILGVQHGSGNGTTTFNLPDFKGRVPVGYDTTKENFNQIGKTGGVEKTLHGFGMTPINSGSWQNPGVLYQNEIINELNAYFLGSGTDPAAIYAYVASAGGAIGAAGSSSTEVRTAKYTATNLQPYTTTQYIIKASGGVGSLSSTVESSLLNRVAEVEDKLEKTYLVLTTGGGLVLGGSWGLVTGFNSTVTNGGFSYSSGAITVPETGFLDIVFSLATTATSTNFTSAALTKNSTNIGTDGLQVRRVQNYGNAAQVCWKLPVTAGDLIRLYGAAAGSTTPSTSVEAVYIN